MKKMILAAFMATNILSISAQETAPEKKDLFTISVTKKGLSDTAKVIGLTGIALASVATFAHSTRPFTDFAANLKLNKNTRVNETILSFASNDKNFCKESPMALLVMTLSAYAAFQSTKNICDIVKPYISKK